MSPTRVLALAEGQCLQPFRQGGDWAVGHERQPKIWIQLVRTDTRCARHRLCFQSRQVVTVLSLPSLYNPGFLFLHFGENWDRLKTQNFRKLSEISAKLRIFCRKIFKAQDFIAKLRLNSTKLRRNQGKTQEINAKTQISGYLKVKHRQKSGQKGSLTKHTHL